MATVNFRFMKALLVMPTCFDWPILSQVADNNRPHRIANKNNAVPVGLPWSHLSLVLGTAKTHSIADVRARE
jgi:hypothetical protein